MGIMEQGIGRMEYGNAEIMGARADAPAIFHHSTLPIFPLRLGVRQ
jgi:hypothetical protein